MQISQIFPHSQEGKKTEELKIKTLNKEKKKKGKKRRRRKVSSIGEIYTCMCSSDENIDSIDSGILGTMERAGK